MAIPDKLVIAAAEAMCPSVCDERHEVGYGYCWEAAKAGLAAAFAALFECEEAQYPDDDPYDEAKVGWDACLVNIAEMADADS